eukprot:scaffold246708_cov28-Tisochrysis_lutea.AAC.3
MVDLGETPSIHAGCLVEDSCCLVIALGASRLPAARVLRYRVRSTNATEPRRWTAPPSGLCLFRMAVVLYLRRLVAVGGETN